MDAVLAQGLQMHRAGRAADAARLYKVLLAGQPDHADALHLFGVLHFQNGYFAQAAELMERAVRLVPENAAFHCNLAEVYRALDQYQRAIDSCRAALRLQPDFPDAANNLGLALHALGKFEEAASEFRGAIRMRPSFALAWNNLGASLLKLGLHDEALAAYRSAVVVDPGLAAAHSNLGQMLVDRRQAEDALPHCLEAVRLQPESLAAWNNLGNVYRALERWGDAHGAYESALRFASQRPGQEGGLAQVHANRGVTFLLEGQRTDAFASFNRATQLAPNDAAIWQFVADAYDADDDHAAALTCCRRIIELQPLSARGHNNLGWALQQEARYADAAASYQVALQLDPRYCDALLNLGGLHEELGEMSEAESFFRRARMLHPQAPGPTARLATLLRGSLPEDDLDSLKKAVAHSRNSIRGVPGSPMRGAALFGLAQVLDARGEHAEAASCLDEANAIARHTRRVEGKNYDHSAHSSFVDDLIAGFSSSLFGRLAGSGQESHRPIFVFGMPRSGTTLVEQVLASHSRVHGAGELRLGRQTLESVPQVMGRPDQMLECLEMMDGGTVRQLAARHWDDLQELVNRISPRPERIVDKLPDNYLHIGLLALLFPRAAFIHVRRHPCDVALSCWMTNFRTIRWADDRENVAGRLRDHARLMQHWKTVLPVTVHEVIYEKLVDDFENEARRLIAAVDLEWEPACRDFHLTRRPVRTASVTQVREPLYTRSVARWKNYEPYLGDLFEKLPRVQPDNQQIES